MDKKNVIIQHTVHNGAMAAWSGVCGLTGTLAGLLVGNCIESLLGDQLRVKGVDEQKATIISKTAKVLCVAVTEAYLTYTLAKAASMDVVESTEIIIDEKHYKRED